MVIKEDGAWPRPMVIKEEEGMHVWPRPIVIKEEEGMAKADGDQGRGGHGQGRL